jgi:hypothetical protein
MAEYTTIRIKKEDYEQLKELQKYLVKKGTDSIDMDELKSQNIVELPEEDKKGDGLAEVTLGVLLGLSAAALAYLIWKSSKGK